MALSGSFSTNKYNSKIGLTLSWSATQSIANNTSKISWTLKSTGSSSSTWFYAGPVTATINGTKVVNTSSRFKMYGGGGYKKTGSITVTHGTDGSKSVSMSVKAAIYSSSVNCTGSKTFALNKINRYALISSATDFNFNPNSSANGSTVVYTNPAGTSMVTGLKIRMQCLGDDENWRYSDYITLNNDGGTYTFGYTYNNLYLWWCYHQRSTKMTVRLDLQSTMNGTVYHDYKDITCNLTGGNPTIPARHYEDVNSNIVAITGSNQRIIQSKSDLRVWWDKASIATKCQAYIVSCKATLAGYGSVQDLEIINQTDSAGHIYFRVNASRLNSSGSKTIILKVTDSRGCTSMQHSSVTITAWSPPTAALQTLARVNGFENQTKIKVSANYSQMSWTNPTFENKLYLKVAWSKVSPISWTYADLPNNTETNINGTTGLNNQYDWKIAVMVGDKFTLDSSYAQTWITTYYTVNAGVPVVFFDKKNKSVGINCFPSNSIGKNLEINGLTAFKPVNISSQYTITKSSGNWSISSITAYRIGYVVSLSITITGNGSSVTAGNNGFVGKITAGPKPMIKPWRLLGTGSSSVLIGTILNTDELQIKAAGNNVSLPSNLTYAITTTFICTM